MKFPERFKEDFIKELEKIGGLMDQTPNQWTKIYLFSGINAFLNRVINFEYNRDLLLFERILQYCHTKTSNDLKRAIQLRMQAPPPPNQLEPNLETQQLPTDYSSPDNIPLTIINPKFFEILSGYIEDLKNCVENEEDLFSPIANITELFYTLTGNGGYLLKKGVIELDLE